jgi:hypothetical protein
MTALLSVILVLSPAMILLAGFAITFTWSDFPLDLPEIQIF